MMDATMTDIVQNLARLRTELVELAYSLDTRRQFAAADVAMITAARLGELCEPFSEAALGSAASADDGDEPSSREPARSLDAKPDHGSAPAGSVV